jgi:hypothetical protein
MKNNDKLLNTLFLVTLGIAALSWPAAILAMGILSRSFLYTLLIMLACAVFVFGCYKFLVQKSYDTKNRSTYWLSMLAGLGLALWTFVQVRLSWVGVVLCVLELIPVVWERQNKIKEDRRLDGYMAAKRQTDADRILRATQATNMRDYASALGLNYIPAGPSTAQRRVVSQFASHLPCQHCSQPQAAKEWPANGDMTALYYQKEPGRYSLKMTCPNCGRDWYVVWDQDPGPFLPLA